MGGRQLRQLKELVFQIGPFLLRLQDAVCCIQFVNWQVFLNEHTHPHESGRTAGQNVKMQHTSALRRGNLFQCRKQQAGKSNPARHVYQLRVGQEIRGAEGIGFARVPHFSPACRRRGLPDGRGKAGSHGQTSILAMIRKELREI